MRTVLCIAAIAVVMCLLLGRAAAGQQAGDAGKGVLGAFANATPRPDEAPVTIATLPSSLKRSKTVMAGDRTRGAADPHAHVVPHHRSG